MRLNETHSADLMPSWMKRDAGDVALMEGFDIVAREIYDRSRLLTTWDKIDQLPEELLDELAYTLDIDWYKTGAPIETKRALIKASDLVHAKKGTVSAVESVIDAYFGNGRVIEWPEYAGEPHHFKVFTDNPTLVAQNQIEFLDLLGKVKRKSSKLDAILIGLTGNTELFEGMGHHQHSREMFQMGDSTIRLLSSVALVQRETVQVRMTANAKVEEGE